MANAEDPHRSLADALRRGQPVSDAQFDRVYPEHVQRVSGRFWTPVDVALTAASWLESFGCERLLDVGSGCGKFCIVASLASSRVVTGLEQRLSLVQVARDANHAYGAHAEFIPGTLEALDASRFDGFYFFNPFGENLYRTEDQLDRDVELSEQRRFRDAHLVESWLDEAAPGTCVVTYHGLGGHLPSNYRLARTMPIGTDHLRLWSKAEAGRASGSFFEIDGPDAANGGARRNAVVVPIRPK